MLPGVPGEDHASEGDLEKNLLPVTKTLGVSWTAREDQFLFHNYLPPLKDFEFTKRNVLKKTVTLFDRRVRESICRSHLQQTQIRGWKCYYSSYGIQDPFGSVKDCEHSEA